MNTYILVHGAWQGAWCWSHVMTLLREAGHHVVARDLPGHGDDRTPAADVTVKRYVDTVSEQVRAADGHVILVGHSMGGMVISQAAEFLPGKLRCLVFLSGFLLDDGQCIRDMDPYVGGSLVAPNLALTPDGKCLTLPMEILREAFYADCSSTDFEHAKARYRPQPVTPFITPVTLTDQGSGATPRVYIECLQDRAIPLTAQRWMHGQSPCRDVHSLDTSHSPFLSTPRELADILLQL